MLRPVLGALPLSSESETQVKPVGSHGLAPPGGGERSRSALTVVG